jgi:integrase
VLTDFLTTLHGQPPHTLTAEAIDHYLEHWQQTRPSQTGLPRSGSTPPIAWATAGLQPLTLHECRHTYAAYMIAAGINTKALSTYMGHASITITLDRYDHLLPGNEHQAATLLDNWLTQAT